MPLLPPRGYSRSSSNRDAPIPSLAGAVTPSLSDMTEGHVPAYDSVAPYGEKNAAAAAFAKMVRTGQAVRHIDQATTLALMRQRNRVGRVKLASAYIKLATTYVDLQVDNKVTKPFKKTFDHFERRHLGQHWSISGGGVRELDRAR